MSTRRSRPASPSAVAVEGLEVRSLLSGMASTLAAAGAMRQGSVEVSAQVVKKAATQTTLAVGTGTLGQPITLTATVKAAASAGPPTGTVNILDHGTLIEQLTLSPTTSPSPKGAISEGTVTLTQEPGGVAYYFGKHQITAQFVPSGAFSKSDATKAFTVSPPAYTTLAGGVKVATIANGSGPSIQSGQTANVLYTGYLASSGHVFDDSISHGGTPLSYAVGEGAVITGFDSGTVGMQVGETRIIRIPPAEGYGSAANGSIPANSTLIFVVTLESIS